MKESKDNGVTITTKHMTQIRKKKLEKGTNELNREIK